MTEASEQVERNESHRVLRSYHDPLLKNARACPFCDGAMLALADWQDILLSRHPVWRVYCPRCGTLGPIADTRSHAIDHWNRQFDKRFFLSFYKE